MKVNRLVADLQHLDLKVKNALLAKVFERTISYCWIFLLYYDGKKIRKRRDKTSFDLLESIRGGINKVR